MTTNTKIPQVPVLTLRGGGLHSTTPFIPATARRPRGGGGAEAEEIDKSNTWTLSDITATDIVYLTLHGAVLAAIVLFCRNAARTGGRAPAWIVDNVCSDPYATLLLHFGYYGLGFLLPWILPPGLARIVFSPPSVALLGYVFPAVESVRAAVTDSGSDDVSSWLLCAAMREI